MLNSIISLFVPNQQNNHKAHLIQNFGLTIILTLIIGLQTSVIVSAPPASNVLGATINLDSQKVIELTNQARAQHQLPPLVPDQQLQTGAQAKLQDMIDFHYWDHYSPSKRTPWKFILDAGYSYQVAGENLGRNFDDPQKLVDAWMDSPGHRANILNPEYQDIAVATTTITTDDSITILIVQFFGTKAQPGSYVITDPEAFQSPGEIYESRPRFVSNPQITTQMIALITIAVLAIILSIDAYIIYRHKVTHRISGKYWAHMVFLYGIGLITYLNK